jgi:hypothetical protein
MGRGRIWTWAGLVCFFCAAGVFAQQGQPAGDGSSASLSSAVAAVPRLVKYSGTVRDARGEPLGSVAVRLSFAVYEEQTGGAALWAETQVAELDEQGQYSVLLGATRTDGLPVELFPAGKARWLGVQVEGRDEDPRVLLVSVPYALKAEDAAKLGGRSASDFVLSEQLKEEVRTQVEAQKPATATSSVEMLVSNPTVPQALTAATSSFTVSNDTQVVKVQQNGTGYGLYARAPSNTALFGEVTGASGTTYGVKGVTPSTTGAGVAGFNTAATGTAYGIVAQTSSTGGTALYALATAATGLTVGLWGETRSTVGTGIYAHSAATSGDTWAMFAETDSAAGTALVVDNLAGGKLFSAMVNGTEKLSVNGSGNVNTSGSVTAASFAGSGSALTALNASNLASGIVPSARFSGTYSNAVTFNNAGNSFTGNGAGLTNVAATTAATATNALSLGAVAAANYARTDTANTFTGSQTIQSGNLALPATSSSSVGVLTLGGTSFLHAYHGGTNIFVGQEAGGPFALTGTYDTATGYRALYSLTSGQYNTANGSLSLANTTSGSYNSAFGDYSLTLNTTGAYNTALGYNALPNNSAGYYNTAVGMYAGQNMTGSYNTAIGYDAGYYGTTGSDNVYINNYGVAGESNTARIGGSYISRTFIAGVRGVTTVNANAIPVLIDSAGQLGTASSSRRVKRDIRDMGDTTGTIMGLRPVRFRYKAHGANGPEQYGLVAEEVAEVAPELVARNNDGEIETVFYDKVNAMLLNEVQKQHGQIQKLEERLQSQEEVIRKLEFRLTQLERQEK